MVAAFLEWVLGVVSAILKRDSAKQLEANRQHNLNADDARKDFALQQTESRELRHDYANLMKTYQKMALDMEQRLESLQAEFSALAAAFEKEKSEHRECRHRLAKNEEEIATLKGQVAVLMQKEKTRGDDAGS